MLPEKMNAVVAHGRGDYRFEQVETPRAGGREIIMKVEACGVCAGDIKCSEGGFRFWGGEGNPAYCEPPFIPGHELLGHVAEVGPLYDGPFKIGDRITSEQIIPCGECRYCGEGLYTLCDPHFVYGFKRRYNGGFAEYVRLPENARNYRVPDSLPMEKAILIEPFACSMHAVKRARITGNDVVVIAGAGTLGLGMIAAAALLKPKALISMEPVESRRQKALELGATLALDAWPNEGVEPHIAAMTQGCGCDVYIEATGDTSAVPQGLQLIKKGGRFIEFSVFAGPASVDWSIIGDAKELDLFGVSLSPDCFPPVMEGIISGTLKTDGVVTHKLPLERYAEAFAMGKRREGIKTVLIP